MADVVAVLEVLADPTANAALARILTGPSLPPRARATSRSSGSRAAHLAQRGARWPRRDGPRSRALAEAVESVDTVDVVALTDALDEPGRPGDLFSAEGYGRLVELRVHELAARSGRC